MIEGEYSGLPIPANAEIVIEGDVHFDNPKVEGPFGEWTGYYASAERSEPWVEVKRLYHRNNPIILGSLLVGLLQNSVGTALTSVPH